MKQWFIRGYEDFKQYDTQKKVLSLLYFVLRLSVVAILVAQLINEDYNSVFMCVLTLILFMIPSFFERRIKIDVPDVLEIIIILFIYAAEILGEISDYYVKFPYWDTMLHTINGFVMAAIGFSMIDLLNKNKKFSISLTPAFVALVAFCFSMTIGVLWEFFEFGMDKFFDKDMQKDRYVTQVNSVLLNPAGTNDAISIPIHSVVINGEEWEGYVDIGLIDTMEDLFVNFVGAVVFALLGTLSNKWKTKYSKNFLLKHMDEEPYPHELDSPAPPDRETVGAGVDSKPPDTES